MRMLIAILFFNNNEKLCSLDFINGFIKKNEFCLSRIACKLKEVRWV